MTESNLPAVRESREVMRPTDTDSWTEVVGEVAKLASYIADTEFVPKGLRGKPAAAAAAMLYGREIGLPPMTALNGTHVIEGTPTVSAEQMRAMVLAAGHDVEFVESTGARCVIRGRRRGTENWTIVEWSIDMARAAGLLTKSNWKNWPRRMLQARASSELCEMIFPDVIRGYRSTEEIVDASDMDGSEDESTSAPVQRAGGARKRAVKRAAPVPALAGPGAVPLPGEPGYDQGEEPAETGAEPGEDSEAASPAPDDLASQPSSSGAQPAVPAGSAADEGGPADEADVAPASVGSAGSPAPDEDGAVDAEVVSSDEPPKRPPSGPVSAAQVRMVQSQFGRFEFTGTRDEQRDERLAITSTIVGRQVESTNKLTKDEASALIDTLASCGTREQLDLLVQGVRDAEGGDQS